MFITKKHLQRRTFLRGLGVTITLPFLESMLPAQTPLSKTTAAPKMRFAAMFSPHGWAPGYWMPKSEGVISELPMIATPLESFRDRLVIFSGLDAKSSMAPTGTTGGDHSRAAAFLAGAPPKRTAGSGIYLGTTVDQIVAQKIGEDTLQPSLQLGIEDSSAQSGVCAAGYSCAYTNSISWQTPTKPLPTDINPQVVFERLFGDGSSAEERVLRKQENRSILDSVTHKVVQLEKNLPSIDRNRLNDYLEDIRDVERRLQKAVSVSKELPTVNVAFGVPESFDDHIKLMFDLMVLAFQGDVTRVFSIMLARDTSFKVYPESGVTQVNHTASHHGENPKRIEEWAKINRYHLKVLAYFLGKLKAIPEGAGNLLDHSIVLYGSNMGNGNVHSHINCGHLIAGGTNAQFKGGRHIKSLDGTSTANLLLTTLQLFGIEKESIGDSTGTVAL